MVDSKHSGKLISGAHLEQPKFLTLTVGDGSDPAADANPAAESDLLRSYMLRDAPISKG